MAEVGDEIDHIKTKEKLSSNLQQGKFIDISNERIIRGGSSRSFCFEMKLFKTTTLGMLHRETCRWWLSLSFSFEADRP